MKIEDLRINQMIRLYCSKYPEWNDIDCRIVGIQIDPDGKENITVDDGSKSHYDGWKLTDILYVIK